ncbi:hypothetical protein LTR78_004549 [Recurvomyces mirabilis]|uniref:Fe2OG dioxygenase domain-containing protein n=2 Tax=Recurvomyces mirabilis TaxID=574656 RepID=A0AAE0WPE6_9PEZI|nr:hypothetical protein LTR78_004549 [Recurvomyces mirabilis]
MESRSIRMSKRPRTLDAFFTPPAKRARHEKTANSEATTDTSGSDPTKASHHATYPYAISHLPPNVSEILNLAPSTEPRVINDRTDLDLVYYQPFVPKEITKDLFEFLRRELFFYRVKYTIKRGPVETNITTPRFTTVFGLDETARFGGDELPVDSASGKALPKDAYNCKPRPIPQCLDLLRTLTENATGCTFNFCLVNYYSTGQDSISYHSDDERFLGVEPAIASFTLGAKRDFLLKHKPTPEGHASETQPLKLPLGSGDMLLMKGLTQSKWLHSIPKRKGGEADKGRINITFRRAMVRGGTDNYYHYNVNSGELYKWNELSRKMLPWMHTMDA